MLNFFCTECGESVVGEVSYKCAICGYHYHENCAPSTSIENSGEYIDICPHCLERRGIKSQIEKINKAYAKMEEAQQKYRNCIKDLQIKIDKMSGF